MCPFASSAVVASSASFVLSRLSPHRRMRLLLSLLVLCLVTGPAWAQTSPDNYGGTFSTPGSIPQPGSRSTVPGTMPGSTPTGRPGLPGATQETGTPQVRTPSGPITRVVPADTLE